MFRCLILLACATALMAQSEVLQKLMQESAAAWNRGDLEAFASYYENAPDTTFMGKEVVRGGTRAILDRYRKAYPTPASRGTLTFSEIVVRPLGHEFALMTGRFDLKRTAEGGGDASGHYTLIWRRTRAGWKIIHDHTS